MTKSTNSVFNIGRIFRALQYSWKGLTATFQNEAAFRQELVGALVLVPVALYFGETLFEKMLLLACLVLILIVEILNSAIETLVDWQGQEPHPMAGRAKDMGSAAVLLAMFLATLVWIGVLLPKFA